MYVYPIQQLAGIAPYILEINTNDVLEHRQLGWLPSLYNQVTRNFLLGKSSGLIFVTEELSNYKIFSKFNKYFSIIPNSVDFNEIPYYSSPPSNTIPHLVFICTPGYTWHGVDKLIGFASEYPDIHIDLVGYEKIEFDGKIPPNIELHGYITGQNLEKIFSNPGEDWEEKKLSQLGELFAGGDVPKNNFSKIAIGGLVSVIGIEAFANIGVSTGLLPTKGLPLPFVSYGGSNLLASFIILGLMVSIYIENGERSYL